MPTGKIQRHKPGASRGLASSQL